MVPYKPLLSAAAAFALLLTGSVLAEDVPVEVGQKAFAFTLPDIDGKQVNLVDLIGERPTVVMFWCPTCPTVRQLESSINEFVEANRKRIHFVAVASNRDDSVEKLTRMQKENNYPFPILRDEGNRVADQYQATSTPHCYLIDREGVLRYIGNIVGRNGQTTLQAFVDRLLAGEQLPSVDRSHRAYG